MMVHGRSCARRREDFSGIPVSAGVCRGKILVIRRNRPTVTKRILAEAEIPEEMNRLERAISETRTQIQGVQDRVVAAMGAKEASIFDAHLLVLEDRTLLDEVVRAIQQDKVNAEHAFHTVAERYAATLAAIEDDYLRERATDMRDVTTRVLNNLLGHDRTEVDLRNLEGAVHHHQPRSDAVEHRAVGSRRRCSASRRTSAARLRTRRSWRDRCAFRRSSD